MPLQAERPEKANIILIITDDLGWQDVKCYDVDEASPVETPNIDALAKKGVLFWQGYSPAPTCAPSRCAIMSGNHPARAQKTHVVGGHPPVPYKTQNLMMIDPWYSGRMPANEQTLARTLASAGYATGHTGKWHMAIGHHAFPMPKDQGFTWSEMNLGVSKRMKPDRVSEFATTDPSDQYQIDENGYVRDQTTIDAMNFIQEHQAQPFFLYYSTWLVHTPIQTRNKALLEKYSKKLGVPIPTEPSEITVKGQSNPYYCAMVDELDYYVGQIVDYLETTDDPRWSGHKLIDNTYIIFTSDNGGMEGHGKEVITDNYPLDGGKIKISEGGIRVPLIITGPDVKADVKSDVLVNGLDFYPTILSLTGVAKPKDKNFDGSDISDLLREDSKNPQLVKENDGSVRNSMFWHFPHSGDFASAIRQGNWKLIHNYDHLSPARAKFELYELYNDEGRVDIEEANNLAQSHPDRTEAMYTELKKRLSEMKASYPYYNPKFSKTLEHKEKAPEGVSHVQKGNQVTVKYTENDAKVASAQLIYTLNGGEEYEEWFRKEAHINADKTVTVELPKNTTHYVINLIDENNFLVSYPDLTLERADRTAVYSKEALKASF